MRDLIFIAVTVAFFIAAAAYTLLCGKIVGPDVDGEQSATGDTVITDDHDRLTVA